jgi:hypothetical protein
LAISTRRFMPPDKVRILLLRLSHSDRSRSTFSIWAGSGALPNRPRLKLTVSQHRLEGIGLQFLRHQADGRAGRAVSHAHRVVAVGRDLANTGIGDAADDADQSGLARAIGAEQGKDSRRGGYPD